MSKHLFPVVPSDFFKLMLTLFLFACQKQVIQKANAPSDEYALQVTSNVTLKPGVFDKYNYEVNLVNTRPGRRWVVLGMAPAIWHDLTSPWVLPRMHPAIFTSRMNSITAFAR